MEKRILLKSQLNDIFKYIENANLNHKDFIWISEESSFEFNLEVPKLVHQPTMYYFKFDQKDQNLVSRYFPNTTGLIYTRSWPN